MCILHLARVTALRAQQAVCDTQLLFQKQSEVSVLLHTGKVAGIEALFKKPAYKALMQQGL